MIWNQWYAVLATTELTPGRLFAARRMGEDLVFARDVDGRPFCLRDRCAHRGAALSKGRLAAHMVECPFHGFRYDSSGRGRLIPANGKNAPVPPRFQVSSWRTFEKHGFIWIWWGDTRSGWRRDCRRPFRHTGDDQQWMQIRTRPCSEVRAASLK